METIGNSLPTSQEIAQLQRQLAEAGLVQAAASAENFRLRDLGNQDRTLGLGFRGVG